jgi:hypothetical protein
MVHFVFPQHQNMFSGTAFPRIPFSGSGEVAAPKIAPKVTPKVAPPAIPFDSLLLASEEERTVHPDSRDLEAWQTAITQNYASVAPEIAEDAKEFLAALCFLATRKHTIRK